WIVLPRAERTTVYAQHGASARLLEGRLCNVGGRTSVLVFPRVSEDLGDAIEPGNDDDVARPHRCRVGGHETPVTAPPQDDMAPGAARLGIISTDRRALDVHQPLRAPLARHHPSPNQPQRDGERLRR